MPTKVYRVRSWREAETYATELRKKGKNAYATKGIFGGYKVVVKENKKRRKKKK